MTSRPNDLAVVGMACRFPGAPTVEQFWENLAAGTESITRFTEEELLATGLDPAVLADPNYVRAKPIIDGADRFDAAYFGLSPREAELTDPQHRIFLEIAAEALERAGLSPDDFESPIGVFAGAGISTYLLRNIIANASARQEAGSAAASTGNLPDCLATRVAYKLNLKGPAYSIQCACSTSLVAVHAACQSLLNFECDAALAGGVAVSVPQMTGYMHQPDGVTSADGHCRPFDARASGTLFGNGAGVVVLMRLDDALKAGYPVAGVIRGSAVNNDGAVKAGFAAPSVGGQSAVIREALANAGLDSARSISYVEAHGTATPLGDPVEVAALTQAFRATTDAAGFCAVGAVKGNVGHLDTAGGVAGLIKTVLALQHRQIPASLHFEVPNPKIEFAGGPFFVNSTLRDWAPAEGARRAGVSAFGVGGTNAHVIVEEAEATPPSGAGRSTVILPLSAKSENALNEITSQLASFLSAHPEISLADAAHTLQRGRRVHEYRRIVLASSSAQAAAALKTLDPARVYSARQKPEARRVAFLFPGQGAQFVGMGRGLYEGEPGFRRDVDRCCDLLRTPLGYDLRGLLFPAEAGHAAAQERLKQTDASQPALFVIEFALARLWMSWGIHPQAMIGHSLGEYVAACLAGVFSLEDALHVVAARGRLTQALPRGEMLAIPLAPDEVRPLLTPDSSIAVINTPSSCVVAGPAAALAALEDRLRGRGVAVRLLETSHAFHSAAVEDMLPAFGAVMAGVPLRAPQVPFISNVTGRPITAEQACDPQYWVRQTRQTVYFSDGIAELLKDPERILLEVGPGMTLSTLTRQNLARGGRQVVLNSMPDPRERKSEEAYLLAALGRLWLAGIEVDWRGFSAAEKRQRVLLPTYPFERARFWVEPETAALAGNDAAASRRRNPFEQWFYVPSWKHTPFPTRAGADQIPTGESSWLVLGDETSFADALAAASSAPAATMARAGSAEVRADDPASYAALFERLAGQGGTPALIVDAWSLGSPGADNANAFHRLLALAQAWTNGAAGRPLRLVVMSDRGMAVRGDETISPSSSALSGACLVIEQEFPALTVKCIDLDGWTASEPLSAVACEVFTGPSERLVAFRGGLRWTRAFERVFAQPASPAGARRLKKEGVYMITGGLGGIGLAIAASLAATVQARLVLVGRTALPERSEWPAIAAAPQADEVLKRRIRAVQALEAAGSRVVVLAADMAIESESRAAVAAALAAFGRIDGAIHAAGVAGGGLISLRTRQQTERVLGAKVSGAAHLRRSLSGIPVDFIALFSSLAGLTGGVGQADYSAANAFLDGIAWNARTQKGPFVVSIDWDVWRETGMAVATAISAGAQQARQATLKTGLSTAEGVAAFHRALDLDYPQVAVSTVDLAARTAAALAPPSTLQTARGPRHARPDLAEAFVEPSGLWETRLAALWQAVLGFDRIGALDNFFDLGGDSLLALSLAAAIKREHAYDVSVTTFYEFPTLRALASRFPVRGGVNFSGRAAANSV